jgi:hypothetical protein
VKVYAGIDPLTGREIRLRRTCKTERAAQIELGKLLAMAQAGRQPDSAVTVVQLLDQYVLATRPDGKPPARAFPISGARRTDSGRVGGIRNLATRTSNTGPASSPTWRDRSLTPVSTMTRRIP